MSKDSYFVVIDPTTEEQPALERAIQSAKMTDSKLHLFQCIDQSFEKICGSAEDLDQAGVEKIFLERLDQLALKAKNESIEVSCQQVWDKNWRDAIISATKKSGCLMVFKPSFSHTRAQRSENTSDWTLLRNCSLPVMLIHNNTKWEKRIVLAAINLAAEDKAHQKLNKNVISIANNLARSFESDVHFVNAISVPDQKTSSSEDDDLMIPSCWSGMTNKSVPKTALTSAFVAKECDADEDHVHLCVGSSVDAILCEAKRLDADLIVIGTVARTGIKGRIIGNTAEKLLDDAQCDILTINSSNPSLPH